MTRRRGLTVFLAAAAAAHAGASALADGEVTLTWHWENARTGTEAALAPGDAARVWVDVAFSPAAGAPINTIHGPATVVGFAGFRLDLTGSGGTEGTWSDFARREPWTFGTQSPQPDGSLHGVQVLEFVVSPPATNPIEAIWSGQWQPADYAARMVTFTADGVEPGAQLNVDLGGGFSARHMVENVDWGSVRIPVVPAPGAAGALGVLGFVVARRRRR